MRTHAAASSPAPLAAALPKQLWSLRVLPHAIVVERMAMSLGWEYAVTVDRGRGDEFISSHRKAVLLNPVFSFLPVSCDEPAMLNWQRLLPSPCSESPSLKHNNGC